MSDDEYMLRAELAEANSEIARHHRDFQRIRDLLDEYDDENGTTHNWAMRLRNIVG